MTVKINKVNYVFPEHHEGFKLVRNVESVSPKIKILENLIKTLIRTELIKLQAYDRWNPYLNHYQSDFLGLVAILDLFHEDADLIGRLKRFDRMNKKLIRKSH